MGTLTEQMENLTADILSGHEDRRAWLSDFLKESRSELEERRALLNALREEVAELREQNRAWIEENRALVEEMLKEVRTDLEGARRAWQGMVEAREGQRAGRSPRVKEAARGEPPARTRGRARRARSK